MNRNMGWNGSLHTLTCIASSVQSRLSYLTLGLLSGCGYARQPQQLHEQHTLVYLVYSFYVLLLCCFSSVTCSVTFGWPFYVFLLRCLWGALASQVTLRHNGAISTIPKASLQEQDGFNAYQVRRTITLRMWLWDCRKTRAFSQYKYVWYNVRTHTNIHR